MTTRAGPDLLSSVALLERSAAYARAMLVRVRPAHLRHPTPCAGWDLAMLLTHMEDSLEALTEAADLGHVELRPVRIGPSGPAVPVVERLQMRACALIGAWAHAVEGGREPAVRVGDLPLSVGLLAGAGALDIAVHGWDVSASLGPPVPVPDPLAADLLPLAHVLVGGGDRPTRFGFPVPLTDPWPSPSERLLAFLGRRP